MDEQKIADSLGNNNMMPLVGHNDKGVPTHPDRPAREFDRQPQSYNNGFFEYIDHMGGIHSDIFYEPIGCVSDNRLKDIYRFQSKRLVLMSAPPDSKKEELEELKLFMNSRGLDIPDVSNWYYTYVNEHELNCLVDFFPELKSFAQRFEEKGDDSEVPVYHLRFTENEKSLVDKFADDIVELDEPMSLEEVKQKDL